MLGGSDLTKRSLHGRTRYEVDVVVFYKEDKQKQLEYHNKLSYVTNSIHSVEMRQEMVGLCSSLT